MDAKTRMGNEGRIAVPAKFRKALGLQAGDEVMLFLEEDQIRMMSLRQAVALAKKQIRRFVPEGASLVDALIEERRKEEQHE